MRPVDPTRPRLRRWSAGALSWIVVLGTVLTLLVVAPAAAAPNKVGYPNSMAAAGDSITKAYNTGFWPFTDAPRNSWSTGGSIESHYRRILSAEPAIADRNFNHAITGAKIADLLGQLREIDRRRVAYVTILIGANDLCTDSVASMTRVARFRTQLETAMAELSAGSPRARIYVASIPNVYRLWRIYKDHFLARVVWRTLGVCRSLLLRPRSTDPGDVERRATVRRRTVRFNEVLATVCARYIHCRFDGGAVFGDRFTRADVSTRDYFHPSKDGQARLAEVSWGATFDFTDRSPPTSEAQAVPVEGGILVTLVATDDVGISGIEYRLDGGAWQRYAEPLVLEPGDALRFRAVDVNGNIEETNALTG